MAPRPTMRLAQRLFYARPSIPPPPVPRQQCRCFTRTPKLRISKTEFSRFPPKTSRPNFLLAALGLSSLIVGYSLSASQQPALLDAPPSLPSYRLSEIRAHDASHPNPWVIHRDKVYDITDWVPAHPGGDVILRAAGGSIDRYWDIFSIHKSQHVYDILDAYLIGYVHAQDLCEDGTVGDEVEDPFDDDPTRSPELITRTEKPRNAETPGYALDASFLTPNDLFYVRNHMWVPKVDDPESHCLTVELPDGTEKSYTLPELKSKFPQRAVTAVLQCSGNRRADMNEGAGRKTNGLPWSSGAISNATWEGVALADVLSDAGFSPSSSPSSSPDSGVRHVHFSGMEAYAASIPVRKATDPHGDVLLAWAMNGAPLPRDHGFPLRSIVPGTVAARSVKWLSRITLSDEECPSQWQRRDYKCFGPNEVDVDWDAAPAIQEMPVQSAITSVDVHKQDSSRGRPVQLGGYAYSGGGRAIVRVDVSLDDGRSWSQAKLLPDREDQEQDQDQDQNSHQNQRLDHGAWSWKRWRFSGTLPFNGNDDDGKCTSLVVKATDEAYNTQPESYASTWNLRGNCTSAWHRVRVCADCKDGPLLRPPEKGA